MYIIIHKLPNNQELMAHVRFEHAAYLKQIYDFKCVNHDASYKERMYITSIDDYDTFIKVYVNACHSSDSIKSFLAASPNIKRGQEVRQAVTKYYTEEKEVASIWA